MACPIVSAPCGQVKGLVSKVPEVSGAKQVYAYLGIPFAKPPIGDLRFEPPQKNEPWEGVLEATKQPPSPAQDLALLEPMKNTFLATNQFDADLDENSEDCLYLNVFSSNPKKDAAMPVLFWIYGGGFQAGGVNYYDPQVLCSLHDVVVVMPNYRLNAFGFLTLGQDTKYKGNIGIKDQILALEWVRDNIREFGGNPQNVTLFGESAGSVSVSIHMVSPLSRDLFHRSIHHSGTINLPLLIENDYLEIRKSFFDNLKITETEPEAIMRKLKSFSTEEIIKAQADLVKQLKWFAVVVDGAIMPDEPIRLIKNKAYSKVPSIVGCNSTEGDGSLCHNFPGYFEGLKEEFFREVLKGSLASIVKKDKLEKAAQATIDIYSHRFSDDNKMKWSKIHSKVLGDSWFVAPTVEQSKAHSEISCGNTYLYQMTQQLRMHHEDGYGSADKKADFCECDHADDIVFTFGLPFYNGKTSFEVKYSEDEKELSRKWMTYLVNFAKTGNPNKGEKVNVEWPNYDKETKRNLTVQIPLKVGENLSQKEVKFWNETLPSL